MRDIPVMLNGYKLTVVEPPMPKVREDGTVITNREGVTHRRQSGAGVRSGR